MGETMPDATRGLSDLAFIQRVKRLALIALFSDDELMELLVLKGGNALDIVYNVAQRSSLDLDFSIESKFKAEALPGIQAKVQAALETTFALAGYKVFDLKLLERPPMVTPDMADFWGGYRIEFKIIELGKIAQRTLNPDQARREAAIVGPDQKRTFMIDISKFEYCKPKRQVQVDNYTIYVYTPEMLVVEKIRAICQQMPEYVALVKDHGARARARDFFDIYTLAEAFKVNLAGEAMASLVRSVFSAKRVPLRLVGEIGRYRDYHRQDFVEVQQTVKPGTDLKPFDFYFEYVVAMCRSLKALWDE
jgi:hypothetical protein